MDNEKCKHGVLVKYTDDMDYTFMGPIEKYGNVYCKPHMSHVIVFPFPGPRSISNEFLEPVTKEEYMKWLEASIERYQENWKEIMEENK